MQPLPSVPLPRRRRPSSAAECPDLGLRRVGWVVIEALPHGHRCQVMGVGHRVPVERVVPLTTALALWRSGVPTVVRRRRSTDAVASHHLAGSS